MSKVNRIIFKKYILILFNEFLQVLEKVEVIIFDIELHIIPVIDRYATLGVNISR